MYMYTRNIHVYVHVHVYTYIHVWFIHVHVHVVLSLAGSLYPNKESLCMLIKCTVYMCTLLLFIKHCMYMYMHVQSCIYNVHVFV